MIFLCEKIKKAQTNHYLFPNNLINPISVKNSFFIISQFLLIKNRLTI